ncbi:MAG: DUF4263 domain-containing protein [Ignavibacteria bacterium]|nr:DUF4263 domain-containing protein [Ignavibacteria bacterium]
MSKIKDKLFVTLRDKPNVITKAAFWKIPHNIHDDEIALKIGRYNKPKYFQENETPETLDPKSELTLDTEELKGLIKFLQENYEPFRQGVKAFIPLDYPYEKSNAEQIKALFSLPEKKRIVDFILNNELIPEEISAGLLSARRVQAIKEFEYILTNNLVESDWQKWFEKNSWVLGSEFVRVLDERTIDTKNISDFLMEAYDGFLDIVEIKRPEGGMTFWAKNQDHGNYYPSTDLVKAISQASTYIYEIEREANSVKFLERVDRVKTIKPRCILIFGRSNNWTNEHIAAFRILNSGFHNLSIMTYDHVLERAKRVVGNAY